MQRKTLLFTLILILTGALLFAEGKKETGENQRHITISDFTPDADEPGLVILRVLEDSPAEKGGIVRGGILLKADGREVNTIDDVYDILSEHKAGDRIELEIRHGDEIKSVELTIEDRLFRPPLGIEFAYPGFMIPPIHLLPGTGGMALVLEVVEGTPAEKAGIKKGDLIIAVDEKELTVEDSLVDMVGEYKPEDTVTLKLKRSGKEEEDIEVTLGGDNDNNAYLGIRYVQLPFGRRFRFGIHKDFEMPRFRFYPNRPGYFRMNPGRQGRHGKYESNLDGVKFEDFPERV